MELEKNEPDFSTFKDVGEGSRSVHLDWYGDYTPRMIIEGFRMAITGTFEHAQQSPRHPEMYFRPIAFMCRHTLELQLKALIEVGSRLLSHLHSEKQSDTRIHGHDLLALWKQARELVVRIWTDCDECDLKPIDQVINDFHLVDPRGDGFRYMYDKSGQVHLANLPRQIGLGNLIDRFDEAYKLLDAAITGCSCSWSSLVESEAMLDCACPLDSIAGEAF